jgi:hypothetical protein
VPPTGLAKRDNFMASSSNTTEPVDGRHPSRRLAVLACLAAGAVFVLAVALLYAGWGGKEEASGLIIVQGDKSVDDATVSLYRSTDRGRERYLSAKIRSAEDRRLRFHIPPGDYQVVVDFNGRTVLKEEVLATDGGSVPLINISAPQTPRSASK